MRTISRYYSQNTNNSHSACLLWNMNSSNCVRKTIESTESVVSISWIMFFNKAKRSINNNTQNIICNIICESQIENLIIGIIPLVVWLGMRSTRIIITNIWRPSQPKAFNLNSQVDPESLRAYDTHRASWCHGQQGHMERVGDRSKRQSNQFNSINQIANYTNIPSFICSRLECMSDEL